MRGCSGCDKQPLSTLSASIEHPLGEAGEKVETRWKEWHFSAKKSKKHEDICIYAIFVVPLQAI